jgi:hypothetical protein
MLVTRAGRSFSVRVPRPPSHPAVLLMTCKPTPGSAVAEVAMSTGGGLTYSRTAARTSSYTTIPLRAASLRSSPSSSAGNRVEKAVIPAGVGTTTCLSFSASISISLSFLLFARPPGYLPPPGWVLVDGQLDAVAANERLEDLVTYRPHLRRLVPDYPAASADYFQRTGLYPIFHIVLVGSEFAVAHPQVLHALWDLFQAARTQWFDHILEYEDGSPWAAAEIYRFTELFAGSWYQDGLTPALDDLTIRAFVEELQVEGIVSTAPAPAELFAEFLAAAK